MSNRLPVTCSLALRSVIPIMLAGFLVLAVGSVLKVNWASKVGLVTFASGVAICGFGNVVPLTWALIGTIREAGVHSFLRDLRGEPRPWVLLISILLIYSTLAVGGVALVLAALGAFR